MANNNNNNSNNIKNATIAILTPIPSILFYLYFLNHFKNQETQNLTPVWSWCYNHPFLLANILFFLNVNVLFWIIGLLQSSHWMIDVYWTVIPVLLVHFYSTHPLAEGKYNVWRSRIVVLLTWVWSIRLTHNYFRRENWQWGVREDWRFSDMRGQYGKNWWWISFFTVYVSQQVFLIGICLPLYAIHSAYSPLNIWDFVAVVVCLFGITLAYYADTQLHDFVTENKNLKKHGQPIVKILDSGIWRYSRHPNYIGEQFWWWGLAIFPWNLGFSWAFVGALINSLCLAYVTVLVEERILKQEYRAEAYKLYQKSTSAWIPFFKFSPVQKDKKKIT